MKLKPRQRPTALLAGAIALCVAIVIGIIGYAVLRQDNKDNIDKEPRPFSNSFVYADANFPRMPQQYQELTRSPGNGQTSTYATIYYTTKDTIPTILNDFTAICRQSKLDVIKERTETTMGGEDYPDGSTQFHTTCEGYGNVVTFWASQGNSETKTGWFKTLDEAQQATVMQQQVVKVDVSQYSPLSDSESEPFSL